MNYTGEVLSFVGFAIASGPGYWWLVNQWIPGAMGNDCDFGFFGERGYFGKRFFERFGGAGIDSESANLIG